MKNLKAIACPNITSVRQLLFVVFLGLLIFNTAKADSSTNPLDGMTPTGLQAGSPTGSFPLSGFDTINPYSGNLNLALPLIKAGGRGSAGYTLVQPFTTQWTVTYSRIDNGMGGVWEYFEPTLNAGTTPIWYSPGYLVGRQAQENIIDYNCYWSVDPVYLPYTTLTRLTFVGPDGTSYEFRDQLLQGAPAHVPACATTSANRGKIFTTSDGQSATFISDDDIYDSILVQGSAQWVSPSGYLKWKDGTVYRIDEGLITWIRDRNGNKLSFTYSYGRPLTITDSLNRQITIEYSVNDPTYGLCNRIKYKGFGGADRTIWITLGSMSTALRAGYSIQALNALFPECRNASPYQMNPTVVTGIWLPNGKRYKFYYNNYGEVARIELPTGGAYEYDWGAGLNGGPASGADYNTIIYRRVLERRVYPTGGTGSSYDLKITFSRPEGYNTNPANLGYVIVNQRNSSGTLLTSEKHYYFGGAYASMFNSPTSYSPWEEGKEYQTDVFASDGTTVLRKTETSWAQRSSVSWWSGSGYWEPAADPVVVAATNTLVDSNQVSKTTFTYDSYNNQTGMYEYGYGVGAPGPLLRTTITSYMTTNPVNNVDYTTNSIHIRNLPAQRSIYGSVEKARETFEYDNYTTDTFHAGLVNRANISGFDSAFTTSYTTRGNATAITQNLLVNGSPSGSIPAYLQYDIAGNVVRTIDPRSTSTNVIATTIQYDDRFGAPNNEARANSAPAQLAGLSAFAFPTKAINALGHTTYAQYDYFLGAPVNGEDVNGVIASGAFNDSLDRPTQIRRAIGTTLENQTTFSYDDTTRIATTSTDRDTNGDNIQVGTVLYDQLGRVIETRQYEGGSNYIAIQKQYDPLGRAFKTSNPFRPGETPVWTTQSFDVLSRIVSVTTPDNAALTTSYSGNTATVTDQAGKARKTVTDALGRLIEVYEDPSGLNYQTSYVYDVLDDVVTVTQGSQQRFFLFDSVKRLIRARNPEQSTLAGLNLSDSITGNSAWSEGYQYDANGNLTQKTDARGVTSTFVYDALNRNTSIDYSDTTPDDFRQYDLAAGGIGRINQIWQSGSTTSATYIDSYDSMGRALVQRQRFETAGVWSASYQTSRTYNLSGGVTSQTYPSGHTVSYSYDAAGRTSTFSGNLGDGTSRTYASSITYSPFGGLSREQYGTNTPLYRKAFYNIRGQLFDTRLSSVNDTWDWNRGRLILYYSSNHIWGQSGTDNNGNVRNAETWIPPENATLDQADTLIEDVYSYDALNRLSSVSEQRTSVAGGWGTWQQQFKQQYTYDRYANRTIDAAQTWGTGINNKQFSVDTATNRLGVPSGQSGAMSYDSAGNLITDTYTGTGNRTYDAESRMTTAADNTGQTSRYTYDANGKRVRRQVASSQEEWQIYGMDGELIAEYPAGSPVTAPQKEYGYRNGELLITATGRFNVALAANGAVATASSAHTCCGFSTTGAINGNIRGPWGNGEGWNDATPNSVPDWIQVDFAGSKAIDEIDVFSLHDNYTQENTPTETQTFTLYGLLAFDVQYWNGSSWVTVPGGSVTGNNKVWRKFTFSPITTSKIRVYINQVPDSWSRVVEIQAFGTSAGGEKVEWLVSDHLGSPRMVADQSGSLAALRRHDYLPFGEELFAPAGGRSAALGYAGDGVRQQFTQKERDFETSLDYFGSRYYSSIQGRYTSVDPLLSSGRLQSPQSWNRYAYVLNNPLRLVDPTGMIDQDPTRRQPPTTGGLVIPNPCTQAGPDCNQIVITTVTTTAAPEPVSTTDVVPVTELQIRTGLEDPFQRGAFISVMDYIADNANGSSGAMGAGVAVGTAETPVGLGAAAAVGGILTGALLYDLSRTIADSIPQDTTDDEEYIPLYRGVSLNHPGHTAALLGMAIPRGGHDDPEAHNLGLTSSIFTSWSRDPDIAASFARRDGPGGVLLFKLIPRAQTVPSPDLFGEGEVLVRGVVTGAAVQVLP